MITLDVSIENGIPVESALSGLERQMPFALAKAINITVDKAQDAVQAALPIEFHLRRKEFIERTIYRSRSDFATKQNLVGVVRVNPERNFLAKFEDGGQKTALDGGSKLAVPIIRESQPNLIINRGDPRNVKAVMALINAQGGKQVGPFKRRGAKRAKQQAFFLIHSRNGNTLVMQRDGGTTRVLYAFEWSVPIQPRLNFDEIALRTALATWDGNVNEAIEYAIETMR